MNLKCLFCSGVLPPATYDSWINTGYTKRKEFFIMPRLMINMETCRREFVIGNVTTLWYTRRTRWLEGFIEYNWKCCGFITDDHVQLFTKN